MNSSQTINVILNKDRFSYDILPLFKSFYPTVDVQMMVVENQAGNVQIADEISSKLKAAASFSAGNDELINVFIDFINKNEESEEITIYSDSLLAWEKGDITGYDPREDRLTIDYNDAVEEFSYSFDGEAEDDTDKREILVNRHIKNELKKFIYDYLSSITGRELPWGTLSGIRPAKIATNLLKGGLQANEIYEEMKRTYYISDEKFDLAMNVALNEEHMLKDIDKELLFDNEGKVVPQKGYSLYVSIPFCPSICSYCTFSSTPIDGESVISGETVKNRDLLEDYLKALYKEIEEMGKFLKDKTLVSVYIGGGTPSVLSDAQLDELLAMLKLNFDFGTLKEFTVECGRPDSIDFEKLKVLKNHGVDRISINPQTMNEKTLKAIGRKHTVDQVNEAFLLARECGFDNINMDFIVGLPGETAEDVQNSMNAALMLAPDSLTVHSLATKRAARLNIERQEKQADAGFDESDQNDIEDAASINNQEIMDICAETAKMLEMEPYYMYRQKNIAGNMENVGYAVGGKECLYNVLIMEDLQWIVALGAGGISKALYTGGRVKRAPNVKEIPVYIDRIDEMIERKKSLW